MKMIRDPPDCYGFISEFNGSRVILWSSEAGQKVDEYMIGAENLEVDLATRYPGPITERVADIEGNRGIGNPSINETIAKSTTENGNREIRDEETLEIIRNESSRTTQPTRDVNIILSPGDFPEIPEFPDTPPNTFGDSPMIPGGEDRSITGEGPERHQEIPQGATHTQSFMTPPRSRPPVRACRKATIERATSKESPHRISARRTASPKRSRSRGNSITVSSPPNSRRIHRTRPRAFPNARVTGVATRSVKKALHDVPAPYSDDMDDYPDFPTTPQEFPATPPDLPIVPLTYGSANTIAALSEEADPPSLIEKERTHLFITFPLSRNLHHLPDVRINVTLGSHDGVVIESHLITGCEGQEVQVIIPRQLLNT